MSDEIIPWQVMHRIDLLCSVPWNFDYQIREKKEMQMQITINDEEGQPAVILSSCHEEGQVNVHVCYETGGANVSIEDLKIALRKLSAK